MNNPKFNWLRWIAVLPLAIVCYFVGYALTNIVGHISAYFGGDSDDYYWVTHITLPMIASGMSGYCFIKAGTFMAPYYKKVTGIILLICFSPLLFLSIFLLSRQFKWQSLLEFIGTTIGLIIAYREIEELFPKKDQETNHIPIQEIEEQISNLTPGEQERKAELKEILKSKGFIK